MILYHGTSEKRGKQILIDGAFKCDALSTFDNLGSITTSKDTFELSTTRGFVYLTNDIFKAYRYGHAATLRNSEGCVYIYKIDIDENHLLIDIDDQAIHGVDIRTVKESIEIIASVRVRGDIKLSELMSCSFTKFPSGMKKILKMSHIKQRARVQYPTEFQEGLFKGSEMILDAFTLWEKCF